MPSNLGPWPRYNRLVPPAPHCHQTGYSCPLGLPPPPMQSEPWLVYAGEAPEARPRTAPAYRLWSLEFSDSHDLIMRILTLKTWARVLDSVHVHFLDVFATWWSASLYLKIRNETFYREQLGQQKVFMELNLEKGAAKERAAVTPGLLMEKDRDLFVKAVEFCKIRAADEVRQRSCRAYLRITIMDEFIRNCGERGYTSKQKRQHAVAETASDEESGLTRDRKERKPLVSSHIIDHHWKLVAERYLVKQARKRVNDPRRRRWRTIYDVPWWMTTNGENDLEDPVKIMHPGSIEQVQWHETCGILTSEMVYAADSRATGPWNSG